MIEITLTSKLLEYMQALSGVMDAGCHDAAQNITMTAKAMVRVDTSSLQDTIEPEQIVHALNRAEYAVSAGNLEGGYKGGGSYWDKPEGAPVDYAAAQEYGPGAHTPYMTPAAEQGWQPFVDAMGRRIGALQV